MNIAIITGASAGIGAEFARQLDKEGLDGLWLVARRREPMETLAATLATPSRIIPADLADPAAIAALESLLSTETPRIRYLVNNAGFGKVGSFADLNREEQLRMIDLNIRALTHLSHIAIPLMPHGACIIQLASSAGFAPLGGFAVYSATKAYVISLSMALASELRGKGIHSIAVCPGPVKSEFSDISRRNTGWEKARFNHESDPGPVAARAIADAKNKKSLSVYGRKVTLLQLLMRILPHQLISDLSLSHVYRKS